MKGFSFARIVVDRTEVSVIASEHGNSDSGAFEVFVDGEAAGSVTLGLYYPPAIGVQGNSLAVWAGGKCAVTDCWREGWSAVDIDEPIHAMYRLARGWCAVTELSVAIFHIGGQLVARARHDEVIVSCRWEGDMLFLRDFEGVELVARVDGDRLSVGELVARSALHRQ